MHAYHLRKKGVNWPNEHSGKGLPGQLPCQNKAMQLPAASRPSRRQSTAKYCLHATAAGRVPASAQRRCACLHTLESCMVAVLVMIRLAV
jgi:hypothetical protein